MYKLCSAWRPQATNSAALRSENNPQNPRNNEKALPCRSFRLFQSPYVPTARINSRYIPHFCLCCCWQCSAQLVVLAVPGGSSSKPSQRKASRLRSGTTGLGNHLLFLTSSLVREIDRQMKLLPCLTCASAVPSEPPRCGAVRVFGAVFVVFKFDGALWCVFCSSRYVTVRCGAV